MSSAADRARGLAHKSESDFVIARLGFEHKKALDMVCFHLQQGIEKLLKALLECRGIEYPHTHNLVTLIDLAERNFPTLEQFRTWLPDYIPYAVHVRYDEVLYPDAEETQSALIQAEEFRRTVHALLAGAGVSLQVRPDPQSPATAE